MRNFDKLLTHFGDALCNLFILKFKFLARDVQLDNGVHPPGIS